MVWACRIAWSWKQYGVCDPQITSINSAGEIAKGDNLNLSPSAISPVLVTMTDRPLAVLEDDKVRVASNYRKTFLSNDYGRWEETYGIDCIQY